jgi:FAD:protein FMN transferase
MPKVTRSSAIPRALRALRRAATAAATVMALAALRGRAAEPIVLHGRTMGSTYNVKYWHTGDGPSGPEVQRAIDSLLDRIEQQMSTWRPDSELSQFNGAPAGEWFAVSPDVAAVVARAMELHRITDGASDVTVGPVLALWGFGPKAARRDGLAAAPDDAALAAVMRRIGADKLAVRANPPALRKAVDGLEVDLSSIAPGYAVDLIIDELADSGVTNAMVELGGEVRAVGPRPDGKPWRIGVQAPPPGDVAAVVPLASLALATSGDFHNTHTIDGVAYTHILDPRTGRPLAYRGASVTIVAPTCFEADGLATAVFVMRPEAGFTWCVDHGVAALFVEVARDRAAPSVRTTPRYTEFVGHE